MGPGFRHGRAIGLQPAYGAVHAQPAGTHAYAGPQVGGLDAKAKKAQRAIGAAAGSATTAALGTSLGAALGITGAAGGGAAASGTAAILGAAGVSVSVPVAGWIAAGVLAGTAATIAIVRAARKKGRKEMERIAAQHGEQGKRFARIYMKAGKRSIEKNTDQLNKLTNRLRAMKGKKGTKQNTNTAARIMEEQRALSIVLGTQIQPAEKKRPLVAGERSTEPAVAETADDWTLYAAGFGLTAAFILVATTRRR